MTTDEKIIKILSEGWEIKISPRPHPPFEAQGFLPKSHIYTSEKEGEVFVEVPFCVGYIASKGDKHIASIVVPFDDFIHYLFDKVFVKMFVEK